MSERDWQKDWELCQRATPGKWEVVAANSEGPYMVRMPYPKGGMWYGIRMVFWKEDAEFITAAREALPYWLQRVREMENEKRQLVVELCHDEAITMSRAAEILGITLYEAEKLYVKWLNERRGDKKHE